MKKETNKKEKNEEAQLCQTKTLIVKGHGEQWE